MIDEKGEYGSCPTGTKQEYIREQEGSEPDGN